MQHTKHWQLLSLLLLSSVLLTRGTTALSVGNRIERVAEVVAGFPSEPSQAVENAVDLIRRGEYSLALVRLGNESKDISPKQQFRTLTAYGLLLAGDAIGAFPAEEL